MAKYEIRKDGRTFCSWTDPRCTPSAETLKNMKAAGCRLFIDGKPAQKSQRRV